MFWQGLKMNNLPYQVISFHRYTFTRFVFIIVKKNPTKSDFKDNIFQFSEVNTKTNQISVTLDYEIMGKQKTYTTSYKHINSALSSSITEIPLVPLCIVYKSFQIVLLFFPKVILNCIVKKSFHLWMDSFQGN